MRFIVVPNKVYVYNKIVISKGGMLVLKYMQTAQQIEEYIVKNDLKQGQKLPRFEDLIVQFGVSKSTIVKALNILESRGVVYQIQGSGVFARRPKKDGYLNILENQGYTSDLKKEHFSPKVIEVTLMKAPEKVIAACVCDKDELFYKVVRLQTIKQKVLCLEESYYRKKVVPFLNESIAKESLFKYLKEGLQLNIGFSDKYLRVLKLKQENICDLINTPLGDPGIEIKEIFYLTSGEVFDVSFTTFNYENAQFYMQSNIFRN